MHGCTQPIRVHLISMFDLYAGNMKWYMNIASEILADISQKQISQNLDQWMQNKIHMLPFRPNDAPLPHSKCSMGSIQKFACSPCVYETQKHKVFVTMCQPCDEVTSPG